MKKRSVARAVTLLGHWTNHGVSRPNAKKKRQECVARPALSVVSRPFTTRACKPRRQHGAPRWLRPRAFAPPRATWRWRTPGRSCASGRGTTRSSGEIRRPAPPACVHTPPPCQRACPARCSQPAAAADQASVSRVRVRTGKPALTALRRGGSLAPTGCPHPFVAGWASCCAGRAGHRRCRPPCTRCTRRLSCTRARSASDRRIASRRHAAAVDTCHRTHGHAWAPQPSACQAYRLPGRAALQAPRPLTRPEH